MNTLPSSSNRPPRVVVGIGGGIAAFKAASLVSQLVQGGIEVRVVMTAASEQFIGVNTLAALSGHPVATTGYAPTIWPLGPHIELSEGCDLLCIAPATADLIGKFANGIADNLLTTIYLQADCKVLIAPAMSNQMWSKPAVQRNLQQLEADGVHQIGPEEGWLSCRKRGSGRMSEPDAIAEKVRSLIA
ncbi:Phosphopantothenoylcysteine decarboxylase [Rosistilla carotiformis]|uniref:Phosphopantothenoylcysteine decarboxylase n=1 Tax=Rosistilla carotiformis TaxID=2528017 RepID=A0A518JW44_9BACT|nr:flavoprotein [Rosistilla carotiformis]QDV69766.1 Phosphopantothenoylcysteine decarboxylase [Rosistilla carotiformis]